MAIMRDQPLTHTSSMTYCGRMSRAGHPKRTAPINIALTPEERAKFNSAAARDGISVAAWLRQLAMRAVREIDEKSGAAKVA